MAMVNMNVNNLLNGKDSRWLQLEVCREFQRNKCSRSDTECKFAHPPANVEVQNGRVTACYDSIKGRCNREKPPCKYFHPPQHLKDQLLINGRNHLALKNALMQQMGLSPGQPIVPGQVPTVVNGSPIDPYQHLTIFPHLSVTVDDQFALMAANPYLTGMPQVGSTYSPYFAAGPIVPTIMGPDPSGVGSPLGVVQQSVVAQQKMPRSDRLEMDMKTVGSYYYDNFAFPGMMPYKRPAADKSGMPVYQPNATTYQQLMQIQQPFVPVSCEYSVSPVSAPATTCASPSSAAIVNAIPDQTLSSAAAAVAKDDALALPASTAASLSTLPSPASAAAMPDPAALAKEVAQQNYAKAVKLAAANQAAAAAAHHNLAAVSVANSYSHLNPLNYTGVALNKQTMALPPPNMAAAAMGLPSASMARYPHHQLPHMGGLNPAFAGGLGGLNHLSNPYAAAAMQAAAMQNANLLNMNMARGQSNAAAAAAAAQAAANAAAAASYPYSFMRGSPYASASMPPGSAGAGYMSVAAHQYPHHTVAQTSVTSSNSMSAAAAAAAAAAVQNNNNNVMQPYKKLKTT